MKILAIDVGGTHVKMLASGEKIPRSFDSGPRMNPESMVKQSLAIAEGWAYEAVSIGYPGLVVHGRVMAEPANLGHGWMGFNFARAFGRPVKLINDAAMQALGAYKQGRLLFLGLGTGLGSAMVVDGEVEPMELAHLPYKKGRTYEDYVGAAGLKRLGKKKWRKHVWEVVALLHAALEPDSVVVGGGNARLLEAVPKGVRVGANTDAFAGAFRLWLPDAAGATPGRK